MKHKRNYWDKVMAKKIKIELSEDQMKLLQKHVIIYIINQDIEQEISSVIPKEGVYSISLTPEDLEELIGNISFVANHEEKNDNLVDELDELAEDMESYLELYQ